MRRGRGKLGLATLSLCLVVVGAAAFALAPAASASSTSSPDDGHNFSPSFGISAMGQTFTVPASPATDNFLHTLTITRIERTTAGTFKVYITGTSGGEPNVPPSGPYLFESPPIAAPYAQGPLTVYPNLSVTPGTEYAWFVEQGPSDPTMGGSNASPYPDGQMVGYDTTLNQWGPFFDLAFTADFSAGQAATATTTTCAPASVLVDVPTSCSATVANSGSGVPSPTGQVLFTASLWGGIGSCALAAGGDCTTPVSYTPGFAGTDTVTGSYQGDSSHLTSSDGFDLNVSKRASAVGLDCVPAAPKADEASTCTATVTDDSAAGTQSTPTGSVNFTRTGAGDFSAPDCTLTTGSCSVDYTPTANGPNTVTATYAGDAKHDTDDGNDAVAATKRDTAVTLNCLPASPFIGQPSLCMTTVTDIDPAGTQSPPQGTVNFTRTGAGGLSATSCNLFVGNCTVNYTPTAAGPSTITATYAGDAKHDTSGTDDGVTASEPPPRGSNALKCAGLKGKLRRQRRGLRRAGTPEKSSLITGNIGKTKRRLAELGC